MAAQRKYDWGKWFGKEKTILEHGVDYHCTQSIMIGMIRNNASQRGIKVHITDNWLSIIIEVRSALPNTNQAPVASQHEPPALATPSQVSERPEVSNLPVDTR
jgi:hypothetical protein